MDGGPELNALVAEHIIARPCTCEHGYEMPSEGGVVQPTTYWGNCTRHWNGGREADYSTNIAFAWHVVERLQELEYFIKIIAGRNGKWECSATVEVGKLPDLNGNPSRLIAQMNGHMVPEAICKMALVAVLELQ